jgi:hypothetical protein
LLELLHNAILDYDSTAEVHVITSWPDNEPMLWKERLEQYLSPSLLRGNGPRCSAYLLFDNAEATYGDSRLWEEFFKDVVQRKATVLVALFCCYGSPNAKPVVYSPGTPPILGHCDRVSLRPMDSHHIHEGHGPIGLLLTREEFDEVVDRYLDLDRKPLRLDEKLREMLHEWTAGHAGAVADLLSMICYAVSDDLPCVTRCD